MKSALAMYNLSNLLKLITSSNTYCIVTHRNADLDAVASTIVLHELIHQISSSKTYILLPEGMDSVSKHFLESLNIDVVFNRCSDDVKCDYYMLVDTASREQIGECSSLINRYILVDHHEVNSLVNSALVAIYDPIRKATSEIVAQILLDLNIGINSKYVTLLIGGILYDSRFLMLADEVTFDLMSKLIRLGGDYLGARSLLSKKDSMTYSEKIARLKGMSRLGIYKAGEYVVVITCIGAFEGNLLRVLIDNGADLGIAIACRDNGFRITIRASELLTRNLRRPISGELAQYLANKLGGSGGGHSLAGGAHVYCKSINDVFKVIMEYIDNLVGDFTVVDNGRWMLECRL